jgi:hypothetical protein
MLLHGIFTIRLHIFMEKLSLWVILLQSLFLYHFFRHLWRLGTPTADLLGSKWSLIGRLDTQREGSSDLKRVTAVRLEQLRNVGIGHMGA